MPEFVTCEGRLVKAYYPNPPPNFPYLTLITSHHITLLYSTLPSITTAFQHFVLPTATGYSVSYPVRWDYLHHLTGYIHEIMSVICRDYHRHSATTSQNLAHLPHFFTPATPEHQQKLLSAV